MNFKNTTLKIVKILRVNFTICLFAGIVASFFMDIGYMILSVFILFCIVLILMMTKVLNSIDRR